MVKKNATVSREKLDKYFDVTGRALSMALSADKDKNHIDEAKIVLDMSSRYLSDAKFFDSKGDMVLAFAALNYAHGWLDAGARLGLFKVKDSKLFTVDD
jgi:uncharacterized protein